MLDAHGARRGALGGAPTRADDLDELSQIRIGAARAIERRAVSNACFPEPATARGAGTAVGMLAALGRHALGGLALHAGLERGLQQAVPGMTQLAKEMTDSLATLAASVRSGQSPASLPPLRQTQLALGATDALVEAETDLMVDSINTIAALLYPDEACQSYTGL